MGLAADGSLLVIDRGLEALLRVDLETGSRSEWSSDQHGSGPDFIAPIGVVGDGSGAAVVDAGLGAVLRVDPSDGSRTEVSGKQKGTGPSFSTVRTLARLSKDSVAVIDIDLRTIFRVDPISSRRWTWLSAMIAPWFWIPVG